MLQLNQNMSGSLGGQAMFSPHWNQMGLCIMYGKISWYGAKAHCNHFP